MKRDLTDLEINETVLHLGEIVKPSGLGRTRSWREMFGIVTYVLETSVYVAWHGLEFEDEMQFDELVSTGQFGNSIPDDIRLLRSDENGLDSNPVVTYDEAGT